MGGVSSGGSGCCTTATIFTHVSCKTSSRVVDGVAVDVKETVEYVIGEEDRSSLMKPTLRERFSPHFASSY